MTLNPIDAAVVDHIPVDKNGFRTASKNYTLWVQDVAALRAMDTGGQRVVDVGGARYWYDIADATTPDNGTTVIIDASGYRRFKKTKPEGVDPSPLDYGATGGANDTTALQAMLDDMPTRVNLLGQTWNASTLTIKSNVKIFNGTLMSINNTASTTFITIQPAVRPVFARSCNIEGPGVRTTYVVERRLISQIGTNAVRAKGFEIKGRVWGSGDAGIYAEFSDGIDIEGATIGECARSAMMVLSCDDTDVRSSIFDMHGAVGDGSGNAYGYSSTHSSGAPSPTNPYGRNLSITNCTFDGPDIWQAVDTHGVHGYEVSGNWIYDAQYAVAVSGGSGVGDLPYGPSMAIVTNNVISTKRPDGTAGDSDPFYGVTIQGGSTENGRGIIVANNVIKGYGRAAFPGSASIRITSVADAFAVVNNVIEDWGLDGIYCNSGVKNGRISGNVFGTPAETGSGVECVRIVGGTQTVALAIDGNVSATGPEIGLRVQAATNSTIWVGEGQFRGTTTPVLVDEAYRGAIDGPGDPDWQRGISAGQAAMARLSGLNFTKGLALDFVRGGAADISAGQPTWRLLERVPGRVITNTSGGVRITSKRKRESVAADSLRQSHAPDGTPLGVLFEAALTFLSARTQPTKAQLGLSSADVTDASAPAGETGNWLQYPVTPASTAFGYREQDAFVTGQDYFITAEIYMDDGAGPPVVNGSSATGDLYLFLANNSPSAGNIKVLGPLASGAYLVTGWITSAVTGTYYWGVSKYSGQAGRSFRMGRVVMGPGRYPALPVDNATASPITRSASHFEVPVSGFTFEGGAALVARFVMPENLATLRYVGALWVSSTSWFALRLTTGNLVEGVYWDGTTAYAASVTVTAGNTVTVVVGLDAVSKKLRMKATGVTAPGEVTLPAITTVPTALHAGHLNGASQMNGALALLAAIDRCPTAAEISAFTG